MTGAVAALVWVILAFAPGVVLARAFARSRGGWWAVGVGPAVSFGLLYFTTQVASRLGLPPAASGAATVATMCVVGVVLVVRDVRRTRSTDRVSTSAGLPRGGRAAEILLAVAIVSGIALWARYHAPMVVPAGWDAMHHGFFIRQILDFRTLDTATVLSSDFSTADALGSSYPLGFDIAVASLHQATGLPVSALMLASTLVAGAIVLPLGTFALATHLVGARSLVPGFAALACVLVSSLYGIEESGRFNALIGLALVPGTALALCPGTWSPPWRMLPVVSLAVLGMAAMHTSELPTALVLAGASALSLACQDRAVRGFGRWFVWAGAAGVASAALLLVVDPAVLGSAGERSGAINTMTTGAWSGRRAIAEALTINSSGPNGAQVDVIGALVVVGCALTVFVKRWRRFLGPTLAYALFVGAYVALTTGQGTWIGAITTPWYRESARLSWNFFVLAPIPVGVAAAAVATVIGTIVARILPWRPREVAAVACGIALLGAAVPPVGEMGVQVAGRASPVDDDAQRAFEYLRARVQPGDRVFDDLRVDGAMWMYVDERVPTLFGNAPYLGGAPHSWKERLWLRDNLVAAPDDACVSALLARYRVSFLYFGERGISDGPRHMTLTDLRASPLLTDEFSSGASHVFRVDVDADPPACARDVTASIRWDDNGQ